MGWQWHQLDDMQIICTLLKTVNHASTSPLSFYRPDALFDSQPTLSKPRRQSQITGNENVIFTASMFGLHQEPVWCWGLRFPTANNMEQTACSTTYTAVIQAVSVTAATAPALMKHILRLVNYCKNTITSAERRTAVIDSLEPGRGQLHAEPHVRPISCHVASLSWQEPEEELNKLLLMKVSDRDRNIQVKMLVVLK